MIAGCLESATFLTGFPVVVRLVQQLQLLLLLLLCF